MTFMNPTNPTTSTELTAEVIGNFKTLGMVAPGTYTVKVENAYWTSTRKGDPMLKLQMTVQGGAFDGSTVWDQATDSPQAHRYFFPKIAAFGIDEASYFQASAKQVVGSIKGRTTEIVTGVRSWKDRSFTEVKAYASTL